MRQLTSVFDTVLHLGWSRLQQHRACQLQQEGPAGKKASAVKLQQKELQGRELRKGASRVLGSSTSCIPAGWGDQSRVVQASCGRQANGL